MNEKNIELFKMLAARYDEQHRYYSFVNFDHPIYKFIVQLGKNYPDEIIPVLLNIIEGDYSWNWGAALFDIVGNKCPFIPAEESGRAEYIRRAWLDWGQANGYLKDKTS